MPKDPTKAKRRRMHSTTTSQRPIDLANKTRVMLFMKPDLTCICFNKKTGKYEVCSWARLGYKFNREPTEAEIAMVKPIHDTIKRIKIG